MKAQKQAQNDLHSLGFTVTNDAHTCQFVSMGTEFVYATQHYALAWVSNEQLHNSVVLTQPWTLNCQGKIVLHCTTSDCCLLRRYRRRMPISCPKFWTMWLQWPNQSYLQVTTALLLELSRLAEPIYCSCTPGVTPKRRTYSPELPGTWLPSIQGLQLAYTYNLKNNCIAAANKHIDRFNSSGQTSGSASSATWVLLNLIWYSMWWLEHVLPCWCARESW